MSQTKKRVACVVTCYKQPNYVRSVTLYEGMKNSGVFDEVIDIRNSATGVWRYFQVLGKLLRIRITKNPDTYLLTFRAYETLPLVLLIALGKQVVYDEFINPVEWFTYEHNKFGLGRFWRLMLRPIYHFLGKRASYILADTPSHARYSADLMNLPLSKYRSIPVSTDESRFHPDTSLSPKDGVLRVLYIGNMLPLYGVEHVIEAAIQLADNPHVEFTIAGSDAVAMQVSTARKQGARVKHRGWVPYDDFPTLFHSHDLLLGGPFGKTVQSQFVITGKTFQFLASGLPVVIGANEEADEFKHEYNALIVPLADARSLRDVIAWAASHRKELETIGKNGRLLYEEKFSSSRVADDLRRLFEVQ